MIALSSYLARGPLAFLPGRAGVFIILAFLLAAQNTYASTLVASLFLAHVGAKGIPLYYVLFAAVSIPFAALFSSVIDRFPRRRLFVAAFAVFTAITLVLPLLPPLGTVLLYASYLLVRVFEHLLYSVYYILIADYFTVTDNKRNAGGIALGMAAGGLAGGAVLTATTSAASALVAAWVTPALVAAAMLYGGWATRRRQPLDAAPASRESFVESLRVLPRLMRRYPMIALMSAAMFLNILLQCIAEFSAFSIYTRHFPRVAELAVFLGVVNAGLSVLGFLVIVLFTGRQLPRLGVPKMNRVYPALDVLTFAVLAIAPSLPAGILANISYDPFEHGIDVPVTTMNYNAIRHRFVGRVRVFIDGIVFPLGLASAGLLLLGFAGRLDLRAVALFGLALSLVLLALHWSVGRHYARGLVEMLRDGAVELDNVASGLHLPPENAAEIRAMLAGDPRTAQVGLEMAVRCDGDIPADEMAAALAKVPAAQARRNLSALAASTLPARRAVVEWATETAPSEVRQLAWAHMFRDRGARAERARRLLGDADEGMRALAAAAILIDDPADARGREVLCATASPAALVGALELMRHAADRNVAAILAAMGTHRDPAVRAAALTAADNCAGEDPTVLDWARRAAADPEPEVRREALALLARHVAEPALDDIAERFLNDASPEVRHAGIEALGGRGAPAASAICRQLHGTREEVQIAAIDAVGLALGQAAGNRLFEELRPLIISPIAFNRRLACSWPAEGPGCREIHAALDDAARRAVRLVMHALDALGHRRTLNLVRTMMTSADQRGRANAIESLASLPQRRFVIPILPLIEDRGVAPPPRPKKPDPALLEEALSSPDPWLRAAAAVARHGQTGDVPAALLHDPCVIVAETARGLRRRPPENCPYPEETLMSRLAFLHGVRLFAETSLDDLIAVDQALQSETYLAGEPIVSEGEPGDRLWIIYSGNVVVKRGSRVLAQLAAGDFFGEMALFDNESRSATVTALDDVEILGLQRDRFHSLARQRPSILMEVCATLVRRLRQTEQQVLAAD
ncbi:MAG TPA: cyclic nucleotide-binding domain-containing protein [Stellaceae bacterium]|nr:cyclic nucleotide-binding domain-containing protein [Stellaceae bacterium]